MAGPLPIQPRHLVAHAFRLATDEAPREPDDATQPRRAISAAYYAVFHALALAVARQVTGGAADADLYRLTRAIDHGRAAVVCGWLTEPRESKRHVAPMLERLRHNPELVAFGNAFVDLQRARHAADYDHLAEVGTDSAKDACDRASDALDLLDRLAGTADLREFLALVALSGALR